MGKHTPTPWLREGASVYALQDSVWRGKPAKENRFYFSVQGGADRHAQKDELEANAEFIVKAVNSHEALTEAVKVLSEALENATSMLDWFCDFENDKIAAAMKLEAEVALARAKELVK